MFRICAEKSRVARTRLLVRPRPTRRVRRVDGLVRVPKTTGFADEGELGAGVEANTEADFARVESDERAENIRAVCVAVAADAGWAATTIAFDDDGAPLGRCVERPGGPPAGLAAKSTLACVERARRRREARTAAQNHNQRVGVGERARDEAPTCGADDQRADGAETLRALDVAEHDAPMRGGDLHVEGGNLTCVVHRFTAGVDERRANGTGDALDQLVEDLGERCFVLVTRGRQALPCGASGACRTASACVADAARGSHGALADASAIVESALGEICTGWAWRRRAIRASRAPRARAA